VVCVLDGGDWGYGALRGWGFVVPASLLVLVLVLVLVLNLVWSSWIISSFIESIHRILCWICPLMVHAISVFRVVVVVVVVVALALVVSSVGVDDGFGTVILFPFDPLSVIPVPTIYSPTPWPA